MSVQPLLPPNANDIAARFYQERDAIERHLERMMRRLTISPAEVDVLYRAAAQVGVDVDERSLADIERLHVLANRLKPVINARLQNEEPRLERLRPTGSAAEPRVFERELVEYFREALRGGDTIDRARAGALIQAEENRREMGVDWPYTEADLLAALDRAVHLAEFSVCAEDINELDYACDVIEDVDELWEAAQGDTALDMQRQAFRMLVTAFETTVFDLMRLASTYLNHAGVPQNGSIRAALNADDLGDVLPALREAQVLRGKVHLDQDDDWSEANRVCTEVVEQMRSWVNVIEPQEP